MTLRLIKKLSALRWDDRGVTALEYGLVVALVAVAIIGTLTSLANGITTPLTTLSNLFRSAQGGN